MILKFFLPSSVIFADEDEVSKLISASSNASAIHDPFPTRLIKDNLDTLAPVITRIVNKSLEEGVFPSNLKHANITPLLKKENLDKEILKKLYQTCLSYQRSLKKLLQLVSEHL